MLHQAISLGSAAAALGALRMDMLTPELREIMPFDHINEAWEIILEKAENGCPFCQYMIGNTYYFLDIIEIEGRKESEFADKEAWDAWRKWEMEQSIPWFEKAFSGGMILAGRNYVHYYQYGRGDLIPPEPEKAVPIMRQGAEHGYPEWLYAYANHLAYTDENHKEALPWALKAVDYARAVQWLEKDEEPEYIKYDLLGICYLLGYGCQQNPAWGKAFLERSKPSPYQSYGLGMMYAEGIGVPEDIEKGVEYLKAAGNYAPAIKALKHYKKSLFGVWRRKSRRVSQ
jgi:hypothetical protein